VGKAIGIVLLALAALGYWRAMHVVERTWGQGWGRWTWWTSIPLWAGAAAVAAILGGPGWASLVIVAGGIFAVVLLSQRSLRGSR
jgi:hypothetical protein